MKERVCATMLAAGIVLVTGTGWLPSLDDVGKKLEKNLLITKKTNVENNMKQDSGAKAENNTKQDTTNGQSQGIKLYKQIRSGMSIGDSIRSGKMPALMGEYSTRMDENGIVYRINTEGARTAFLAVFNGVIGEYQIGNQSLVRDAPEGYLFGVIYSFDRSVSVDALENKIKNDYPEVKENPEQIRTDKFSPSRGINFDVVTITKTWESERVKATIHFVRLDFPDKSLSDERKKEETCRVLNNFRWTDNKVRVERIYKGMPLALDGKSLVIIDKKIESKIQEIAKEAKQQHLKKLEDARKKAEQKALDF